MKQEYYDCETIFNVLEIMPQLTPNPLIHHMCNETYIHS